MAMLSAMYSGVSGLASHGQALSSVADNIANINTHGFKASRTNFGDVMVQSLSVGGSTSTSVGTGSRVVNVQDLMTQGAFEATDIPTDLAINGAGFFQLSKPSVTSSTGTSSTNNQGSATTATEVFYSRAGQFLLNKDGYLVNPLGYQLQGFNADSDGNLDQFVSDLRLLTQQVDAIPTDLVEMSINLDAEDTSKHAQGLAIDPTNQTTWNYMNTVRVYDSLGIGHDMSIFYQRLDSYSGATVSGESSTWKASVFENNSGTFTANPTFPTNTYYLHFDTDGHLLGTSSAPTDVWTSNVAVNTTTEAISDNVGEKLGFTGAADPTGQEIYTTGTISFSNIFRTTDPNPQIVIDGSTYTVDVVGGGVDMTAAEVAEEFANQINNDLGGVPADTTFYAISNGSGQLTIYAEGSPLTDMTTTSSQITVDQETSMQEIVDKINNGVAATGAVYMGDVTTDWDDGADIITIGGIDFTYATTPGAGTNEWNDLDELVGKINQASLNVTATTVTGSDCIYITADEVGTWGETVTIAITDADSSTGASPSGGTLLGGVDPTFAASGSTLQKSTLVSASAEYIDGAYSLRLARTDGGASATLSLDGDNDLGETLSSGLLEFNSSNWTQTQAAADWVFENQGEQTLTYNFPDATGGQNITFDFTPTASSTSSQSAGNNETFFLQQDGSPRGTLQGIDIDETGLITGSFSNGSLRTLGAVVLTNFNNPNGLTREGDNLWSWSLDAGDPLPPARPGEGNLGFVEAGALEQSNVDLAGEFVKMINYQRAYQANTRTISTTDQMLAELINLKR
jgi:flagellar hook protein FlgE